MATRDRAGGAGGTTSSLARKGLPEGRCGLLGEPSGELPKSEEEVETHRGVPLATGEPVHPGLEDWLSLPERTTGGSV